MNFQRMRSALSANCCCNHRDRRIRYTQTDCLLWPPYGIRQAIIFLPRGFFLLSFFLLSLFSSPNLSGRRLDVYHTSTHGVAPAQIYNAGLTCATRGSLETQDPKMAQNYPSAHHRTNLSGHIFTTKACMYNRKKTFKQQYLLHMSSRYGELRPTSG